MSKLLIQYRVLGAIGTNTYFLVNQETQEVILVDPADNAEYIADQCKQREYKPAGILLTHGHFDHIYAVNDLKKAWPEVKVYAFEGEKKLMADPWMNRSKVWAEPVSVEADVWLKDREKIQLAGFDIEVLHTPGHTSGSCCYYIEDEKTLMSGDTLFCESYGRTDLDTGSESAIFRSIQECLLKLPDDVDVYPGHMDVTTIEHEKKYNPAVF
ncbi:MAG: MBL fold metallo-hydrolase [Clostridiales bacterium]|nr:MBL fold metallo-hydrolase [Clostridiales bacterium]